MKLLQLAVAAWSAILPTILFLILYPPRHKSNNVKVEEVKGKMHVCNSHLESPIDQVVVATGLKMTAAEIVAEALIKFDLVVSSIPIFCHLIIVCCVKLNNMCM